jgi:hypothetical protein
MIVDVRLHLSRNDMRADQLFNQIQTCAEVSLSPFSSSAAKISWKSFGGMSLKYSFSPRSVHHLNLAVVAFYRMPFRWLRD